MKNDNVQQLYPLPAAERPLKGLFLSHDLRQYGEASGRCYVYSNFVSSIDGRIAIPHPLGDPAKSPGEERTLRRALLEKALTALETAVSETTVFDGG